MRYLLSIGGSIKWAVFLLILHGVTVQAASLVADIALFNGAIYTVDNDNTLVDSIAIKDNHIVFVGSRAGLQRFVGADTTMIDLQGKMVLPGFVDSHSHPFYGAWFRSKNLLIEDSFTVAGTLREIREFVEQHPGRTEIVGANYLQSTFLMENGAVPTKAVLDGIDNTRPIWISESSGHSIWVNSKALELAGIDKNTPDPTNGRIGRLPNTPNYGEPSGQLYEDAMLAVMSAFQLPNESDVISAFNEIQPYFHEQGLTTVHSMGADYTNPRQKAMYAAANKIRMIPPLAFELKEYLIFWD